MTDKQFRVKTTATGGKTIMRKGMGAFASFSNDAEGRFLYGLMTQALAREVGASLFDEDSNQFIIGTMGQMLDDEQRRTRAIQASDVDSQGYRLA